MLIKSMLAGVMFLGASAAMAYPAVGDRVEWTGSVTKADGTSVPVTVTKEVIAYSETTKKWTVREDKVVGGVTESETEEKSWLFDGIKYGRIMVECVSRGGELGDILVPAGTFGTCHFTKKEDDETKEKWIGDVPFGIVKYVETDTEDGETKTLELNSVTRGK